MSNISKVLIKVLPPVIVDLVRKTKGTYNVRNDIFYKKDYTDWEQALGDSTGYADHAILTATKDALLKVKNGEATYERDSILYDEIQYSWPLLASLLKIAIAYHGRLHLVDFGGSLGTSYYQNRHFLNGLSSLKWRVVDQKHVVECGKEYFENETLKFHDTIEDACKDGDVNSILLSGVLQYLPDPYERLSSIISANFDYIVIDRTSFISASKERLALQVVPAVIYNATFPCWFFNEDTFLSVFTMKYDLIASFNSFADSDTATEDGKSIYWKGFFFRIK